MDASSSEEEADSDNNRIPLVPTFLLITLRLRVSCLAYFHVAFEVL